MKANWLVVAACCCFVGVALGDQAQAIEQPVAKPAESRQDESAVEATKGAEAIYASLLEEYRSGKTGLGRLELLHNWSQRIALGQSISAGVAAPNGESAAAAAVDRQHEHQQRMKDLQKLVDHAAAAGKATALEEQAAQYFVHEAGLIPQLAESWRRWNEDREMDVELPSASEPRSLIVQPKEIFVNLDQDGSIFVAGKRLTPEQLTTHLTDAKKANPGWSVIIRADRRCKLASVVDVINTCNRVGMSHSLTTSAPTEQ